jgi:hypothetical protein
MRPITIKDVRQILGARTRSRLKTASVSSKLVAKDWITITLSVLALTISALSAYWTIIRQVDDIRVIVTGSPFVIFDKEKEVVKFYLTNGNITFTNIGNRSAAIVSAWLELYQPDDAYSKCDERPDSQGWLLETAGVVVKAGDVSVQSTRPTPGIAEVAFPIKADGATSINVGACIRFYVITPGNTAVESRVFVGEFNVPTTTSGETDHYLNYLPGKPEVLFQKRSWSIF